MIISDKTWPTIESRINKILNETKKIKQQKPKVLGQKPVKRGKN